MKKFIIWFLAICLLVSLGYVAITSRKHPDNIAYVSPFVSAKPAASIPKKAQPASALNHVVIIVEENKLYTNIVNNPKAPYFNKLLQAYASASNYQGVTHPSLPNYLALTSGSTHNVKSDCNPPSAGCIIQAKNIADEIEQSGRTWKLYAEDMPESCYAYNKNGYATKHNPFVYYSNIITNADRCKSHVVPISELAEDLQTPSTTPNYIFIVPNLCHDMHDCSIAVGDEWLASHVPAILNSPAFTTERSLLVVTWDEGTSENNHIPTLLAGNVIRPGYTSDTAYDHYALLHTIESLWGVSPLTTNDANAPLMNEFFANR